MKRILGLGIFCFIISCKKSDQQGGTGKEPEVPASRRCGIILTTPVLDSFKYPTYYIKAIVAFPEGQETVQIQDNVTGSHDGSWYLPKCARDSTVCVAP